MAELIKEEWIRSVVPGKTFADIGAVGGNACNEMATVAARAGAREVHAVDVLPFDHPFWKGLDERCRQAGVDVQRISADLNTDPMGPFDVVHCSGIIYHEPNPVRQLLALRKATGEKLIFTSMIVPETGPGWDLRGGQIVFVPALHGEMRRAFAAHFKTLGVTIDGLTIDTPFIWINEAFHYNYGPWWWLFTPDTVERLLQLVGFAPVRREETWPGRAVSWVCEVR